MRVPLQKWGNSQGVRIGKQLAEQAGLEVGKEVDVVLCDEGILVRAVPEDIPSVDLNELLAQIPEGTEPPSEIDWGEPVGNEAL